MKTLIAILFAALAVQVQAQTNVTYTTNWAQSVHTFRVVDGQLYNTEKSILFEDFRGTVLAVLTNGVVLNKQRLEKYSYRKDPPLGDPVRSGNFIGRNLTPSPPVTRTEWVSTGQMMLVKNSPDHAALGDLQSGKAIRAGTYDWQGDVIECWDYGTPNYVMLVSTNGRAAFTISTNKPAKQ